MEAPPIISPRIPKWMGWAGGALLVMAVIILFRFNPAQYGFYPKCQFYALTGLHCPGCGAQRALHSLVHGHVLTALRYNSLLIISLPFLAYAGFRYLLPSFGLRPLPTPPVRAGWIILLAVSLILFAIFRNIPYPPFTYLAPP